MVYNTFTHILLAETSHVAKAKVSGTGVYNIMGEQ